MTGPAGRGAPWQFDGYVLAEADGIAAPEQLLVLAADPAAWRFSLGARLREAEENLRSARSLPGDERDQVVADLELEVARLEAAVARQTPERRVEDDQRGDRNARVREPQQPLGPARA